MDLRPIFLQQTQIIGSYCQSIYEKETSMSGQQIKILEMLEEGKLTVEEAHKLLGALSDDTPGESQREQPFRPYAGVEDAEHKAETEPEKPTIDLRNLRAMPGAIFAGAKTEGARFEGANLTGAILSDADLRNADLRGASLKGTILTNADLRDTDLRNANFSGSILEGADFRGVKYPGLKLTGVIMPGYRFRGDKPEEAEEGAEEQYAAEESHWAETDRPVVVMKAPSSSKS